MSSRDYPGQSKFEPSKDGTMHIDPALYDQNDFIQAGGSEDFVNQIAKECDGRKVKTVIDIGCGTGKVTKTIFSKLNCEYLVALDKSSIMIEYANKAHHQNGIQYKVGDIEQDYRQLQKAIGLTEGADIVLSLYCIHWVKNHKKAMENIYSMLKPGGKMYLLFFFWSDVLPVQELITQSERWSKYFHVQNNDIVSKESTSNEDSNSTAPFPTRCPNEEKRLREWYDICQKVGFKDCEVELVPSTFDFETFEEYQGHVKAICHYFSYIPTDEQMEFFQDFTHNTLENYFKKKDCYPTLRLSCHHIKITAVKP